MSSYEVSTSRTITVSGVKPSTSEDTVTLYFESKRAANVDVDHIKYDEERKVYTITFKETVDISELLRKSHKIEGATLSVQIYTPPKCYPNKVLIKGINPQTSDDNLSNFLEARTKEDVKNIEFSNRESGKAIVTFGNTANVTVIDKKIKERMLESCRLSAHFVPESQCIVVRGFSQNCSRYTLEYYFENKKRSGVEGVEDVKMDKQGRYCLVFFTDAETALKACEEQHTVDDHVLDVRIYHDCLGLLDSRVTASVTNEDLSDNSRDGVISEPEPLIVEGIDKRKLEFVNSSEGYKQTLERQLRKFDGKVDWDSRKLPESLVINCSRIKDYNRDWTCRIKDEVKKVFDSLLVMEISLDINVFSDVMNKVRSVNVPDPKNVSLVPEKEPNYKLIVVGECTAVQQLSEIVHRIVTDVNNELNKKSSDSTYTRQLKYFQIKILGVVEFQSQASKRFNTISVVIDDKNQEIAFFGPEEQINEVKLFLFETLDKIESKLLQGISQLFIEFIEDQTISQMISETLEQRNVKGIWIAENDYVTVYALSVSDVDSIACILEDSVQEYSLEVKKWQESVLYSSQYSYFISLLVDEYKAQSITVKIGNNRDRVTIFTTKRHPAETIIEKVRRFLEDNGQQEFHVTLSPDKSKLFQELMKTQIADLSEELKDRDVTFTIQEDGILLKGKSEDFVLAKSKLEPLLTCVNVVADNPKFHKIVKRVNKKGELRQVSVYDDDSESSDDDEDGSDDHSSRLRFDFRGKQERFKAAGGQEVVVVKGDITDLEVDVIVSGASRNLQHKFGLGKVIVNKGGRIIEEECRERVNQSGQLDDADVFCSKPGHLKSRMIVHAVGPVWKGGKQGERDKLITCVELALAATEKNKFLSIAIPALGTGGYRFPPDISAKTIVHAIRDYFKWHPSSSVRTVCLCDVVGDTVLNFTKACKMYFNNQSLSPSGGSARGNKRVLSGSVEIKLVQGQLSSMKVGVIVNTTSKDLNLEQGIVSASLLKAGGPSIQQECRSKYPQGINFGDVAVTTGGNLKCQVVCHGCLQQWRGGGSQEQDLEKFVMSCLYQVDKNRCSSIAFPAMGTGKLGYPPDVVASVMYSCVDEYAAKNSKTALKEVLFVLYDKDHKTVKAFQEEESGRVNNTETVPQRSVSAVVIKRMTEEEKRGIIQEVFEAKRASETKLDETKEEMKKKERKLYDLQTKISDRKLFMRGEKEALDGNTVKYFDLFPVRSYEEGSAAQTHFRLAESQFYRLMAGNVGSFAVTKVQYIVNPPLVKQFNQTREKLKKIRGDKESRPILVFHGTQDANIKPIVETNFKVPGQQGFQHRTDTGYYGRGVYFSEYPNYSMGYIQGTTQLLLSQILPGKVFNCSTMIQGAPLQTGYDSHLSPDGKEWVIFDNKQILPFYIVHYTAGAFAYGKKP